MRWLSGTLLGLSVLWVVPSSAAAFCRATTVPPAGGCECTDEGLPLFWRPTRISYGFDTGGFPDLDDDTVRATFSRSFEHWTDLACEGAPIDLDVEARSDTKTFRYSDDDPYQNLMVYLDRGAFLEAGGDRHAFAYTWTRYQMDTGELAGADILFNGGIGPVGVCPDEGCDDGTVDLENVATHEIGHFFGLAHSETPGATMECTGGTGEVEKRTLAPDDVAGICSIYGETAIESREPLLRAEGSHAGCGVGTTQTPEAPLSAWLFGAVACAATARCARNLRWSPPRRGDD